LKKKGGGGAATADEREQNLILVTGTCVGKKKFLGSRDRKGSNTRPIFVRVKAKAVKRMKDQGFSVGGKGGKHKGGRTENCQKKGKKNE